MRKLLHYCFLAFLCFSMLSCKEDFEIFEKGEEEIVIFSILNIKDTIQYVHVFKTYYGNQLQTEGYLDNSKLLYYDTSEIVVCINEYKSDVLTKSIVLSPTYVNSTNENRNDLVYYTKEFLQGDCEYEVIVKNKQTQQNAFSRIKPLGLRNYLYPFYSTTRTYSIPYYYEHLKEDININLLKDTIFREGSFYRKFYYKEIENNDTILKYLEWGRKPTEYFIEHDYLNGQFYCGELIYLSLNIPFKPNVRRLAVGLDMGVYVSDKEVQEYNYNLSLSRNDFNAIAYYENIENGIGIVSSKYFWPFYEMAFMPSTLDSLAHSKYSKDLNFADSQGNYHNF